MKVLGPPTPSRNGGPSLTAAQSGYTRWDLGKQPQSRSESPSFNFVLVYCQSVVTAKKGTSTHYSHTGARHPSGVTS
jgi:hypothetical protein